MISQSFRLPAGRPTARETASRLGLSGRVRAIGDDALRLSLSSRRFAYAVRVRIPGFAFGDDACSVEPGAERALIGHRVAEGGAVSDGRLTALNLAGHVRITEEGA